MKGSKVTLAKLTVRDLQEYFNIVNNKEVKRFYEYAFKPNIEKAKDFLIDITTTDDYLSYKILNMDNIMVGIFICEINQKALGISYIIGDQYRKKGYATMAIEELINKIKKMDYYNQLFFLVNEKNIYSSKVLEKLNCKTESVVFSDEKHILYEKII